MDRIGDTARKGFDFLKSKAMETVEVTKIGSNIRELEERRNQCLLDIGHRVMAMYDTPVFDKEVVRDRVEEVRSLNLELDAAKLEYEAVKTSLKSSVEDIMPHRAPAPEPHRSHAQDVAPEAPFHAPNVPEAPEYN